MSDLENKDKSEEPGILDRHMRRYELIQSTYKIITSKNLSIDQQIDHILETGCRLFDEEIGILSEITGNR